MCEISSSHPGFDLAESAAAICPGARLVGLLCAPAAHRWACAEEVWTALNAVQVQVADIRQMG